MVDDKMCFGTYKGGLMARVDPEEISQLIQRPGAEQMIHGGRPMTGYAFVEEVGFAEDYDLMPLEDLATYIEANHHLPGIPQAQIIESEGLEVGDMQAKLMEKVEELTLYLLEMQNRSIAARESSVDSATSTLEREPVLWVIVSGATARKC